MQKPADLTGSPRKLSLILGPVARGSCETPRQSDILGGVWKASGKVRALARKNYALLNEARAILSAVKEDWTLLVGSLGSHYQVLAVEDNQNRYGSG